MVESLQLVECPRDAMQGWKTIIPAQKKIAYINSLLKVGFHTIDMGSFVSPKLIPQMADTAEVVTGIDNNADLPGCWPLWPIPGAQNRPCHLTGSVTWVSRFQFPPHFNNAIPIAARKNLWSVSGICRDFVWLLAGS